MLLPISPERLIVAEHDDLLLIKPERIPLVETPLKDKTLQALSIILSTPSGPKGSSSLKTRKTNSKQPDFFSRNVRQMKY